MNIYLINYSKISIYIAGILILILGIQLIHTEYFLPGDVVYFNNPDVSPKNSWWRGENAVVLEDGTFFGHGLGIGTAKQIIQGLNKTRKPGSNRSAYLTNLVARPSFEHLARVSMLPRDCPAYKVPYVAIHHNESSISYERYLFYLNKVYNQMSI